LPEFFDKFQTRNVGQYKIVPLTNQGELIGMLLLGTDASTVYDADEMEILKELGNSLALAIHHSRLHQDLADYVNELARRNEELDAFAHTVAHDLKSPIGVIAGYCDILIEDAYSASRKDIEKYLAVINRTTHKMNDIINELLLLAEIRKQDVVLAELDMDKIVHRAYTRLDYVITKNAAQVVIPEKWPVALGYGPWIEQVWVNYINNALKYGGNPPKIWLGADKIMDEVTGDFEVKFWVQDNGNGLSLQEQSMLFAPFMRVNQVRVKGHGLGLSIVHRIITKLEGSVGVESEGVPGQGSCFYFTLPAYIDSENIK
jgi:K+-sensing histidine kinase KdpD